ncbi:MAG: hypothetical protein IJ191_08005 [Treponema sp.]|nr:hypothetical protein [Treponema sp.]
MQLAYFGKRIQKIDVHSPINGVVVADENEFRENMKAVIANSNSFGASIKPLLENILKLDDAGVVLITDEVNLLLRHSNLQSRIQNISAEKTA